MPTVYTPEEREKVIQALIIHKGIVTYACEACGITRPTFYNWYRDDPDFKFMVDDIQEMNIDFVENKLFNLIEKGDVASTLFYLKTRAKKRGYIERQVIEHGGVPASEGGVPIQTETTIKQHTVVFKKYDGSVPKEPIQPEDTPETES